MRILILGAFQSELESITQKLSPLKETIIAKRRCLLSHKGNIEIAFSLSGLGTTAAACTTTALCEAYEPELIIMCGVAGGLEKDHKVGDLVLSNEIIDIDLKASYTLLQGTPYEPCLTDPHSMQQNTYNYTVHSSILNIASTVDIDRLKVGKIVTSNMFPSPKEQFDEIIKLGCSAIEMESVGVFKAASYYGTPVITVRAISNLLNNVGDDLGTEFDALALCSDRIAQFLSTLLSNTSNLELLGNERQQNRIAELVKKYDLSMHPEGGWYRRTFESVDSVTIADASRYGGETRAAGTSIIYLLSKDDYSAWHTVNSDETWSFHAGDSLLLREINPKTGILKEVLLNKDNLQYTVRAGFVFSAEPIGRYSILGCMVTPGFDFKDFRLISRNEFIENYPMHESLKHLSRDRPVVEITDKLNVSQSTASFFDATKKNTFFEDESDVTPTISQ